MEPPGNVDRMRYALHDREDASELRFRAGVRANNLCSEETDVEDVDHARRLPDPRYELHDFDIDGIVRGRGPRAAAQHRLTANWPCGRQLWIRSLTKRRASRRMAASKRNPGGSCEGPEIGASAVQVDT
jgi:hypothetical protein